MRTSVAVSMSSSTRRTSPNCPIDRIAATESVIALLSQVETAAFPPEEKFAVGKAQSEAMEALLDGSVELR